MRINLKSHQHWWLAGDDLEIGHFERFVVCGYLVDSGFLPSVCSSGYGVELKIFKSDAISHHNVNAESYCFT